MAASRSYSALFLRHVYKFHKTIALYDLEIFYDSGIQRLRRLSEFFFYKSRDISHSPFSSINGQIKLPCLSR